MSHACSSARSPAQPGPTAPIEIEGDTFHVDAAVIGELLKVAPAEVPELMRSAAITSICERGVDEHAGQFRLSFFYKSRRIRLSIDETGRILQRSAIDFGDRPMPKSAHAP